MPSAEVRPWLRSAGLEQEVPPHARVRWRTKSLAAGEGLPGGDVRIRQGVYRGATVGISAVMMQENADGAREAAGDLIALLADEGVSHLFINPGTDSAPIQEALATARAAGTPSPQAVLPR